MKFSAPKNVQEYKKQMIIVIAMIIAFCVGAFVIISLSHKREEKLPEPEVQTSSSTIVDTTQNPETEPVKKTFKLLESESPTLQGHVGVKVGLDEEGNELWKQSLQLANQYCTPESLVEGKTTAIGNHVYRVPVEYSWGEAGEGNEKNETTEIQLSGLTPISPYGENQYLLSRQEWTGLKIHMLDYDEEKEAFEKQWEKGQSILNEEIDAEPGTIIVDGRYLPGSKFVKVEDELFIPLAPVSEFSMLGDFRNDVDNSTLTVPYSTASGFGICRVPYDIGKRAGSPNNTQTFKALVNGEQVDFRIGDSRDCYVPASELSRYTGWYIYTNDDIINIVTDELNVSNLAMVKKTGATDLPIEMQIEQGGPIVQHYDPAELENELSNSND